MRAVYAVFMLSVTDMEHLSLTFSAGKFKLLLHRANTQATVWNAHKALLGRKDDQMTSRQALNKENHLNGCRHGIHKNKERIRTKKGGKKRLDRKREMLEADL